MKFNPISKEVKLRNKEYYEKLKEDETLSIKAENGGREELQK